MEAESALDQSVTNEKNQKCRFYPPPNHYSIKITPTSIAIQYQAPVLSSAGQFARKCPKPDCKCQKQFNRTHAACTNSNVQQQNWPSSH